MVKALNFLMEFGYPVFRRFMAYEVYAYLAVGALNTALNILLFILFFQFIIPQPGIYMGSYLIASYTVSLLIAFAATVPTGYWLAKHFAFKSVSASKKEDAKKLLKYFLVVLQGLVSDYLLLKFFVVVFLIYPTIAKIMSTFVVLVINYLLQKYFTFKKV